MLAVSAAIAVSCADITSPTSAANAKVLPPSPTVGASFSRYILISGAWVCVEGCALGGN